MTYKDRLLVQSEIKIKLILSRDNINNKLDCMVVDLLKSVFLFQPYS